MRTNDQVENRRHHLLELLGASAEHFRYNTGSTCIHIGMLLSPEGPGTLGHLT